MQNRQICYFLVIDMNNLQRAYLYQNYAGCPPSSLMQGIDVQQGHESDININLCSTFFNTKSHFMGKVTS